jgi:glycosyltransferase involved in cell wall biosynthesis
MRIAIDMQAAQDECRHRGIGSCALSMAKAICRASKEHTIFLVLNALFEDTVAEIREIFLGLVPQHRICLWYPPLIDEYLAEEERNTLKEAIREGFFASLKPDAVLIPALFLPCWNLRTTTSIRKFDKITPVFVIHYDLIPVLYPEKEHQDSYFQKTLQNKLNDLRKASKIFTISRYTETELLNHITLNSGQIETLRVGQDSIFRKISVSEAEKQNFLAELGIKKDYVLYVGGEDERKNLPRLIKAFSALDKDLKNRYQLVLAGEMSEKAILSLYKTAKACGLSKTDLVMTGYVSTDDLVMLYNCCTLFVFPSVQEGFGLPPLEAMACGAPVIVSNASSVPEAVNLPSAYFDPLSVSSMLDKLTDALTNSNFREELAETGLRQTAPFSWDINAKRFLELAALEAVEAELPAFSDNSEIIKKLAGVVADVAGDNLSPELTEAAAISFAQNFPKKKQLLIDITELVAEGEIGGGIKRIERNILVNLLNTPVQYYEIIPVCFCHDSFYNASGWLKSFLTGSAIEDRYPPLIAYAGDILLIMEIFAGIDRYFSALQELRLKGVTVKTVVYDLLPLRVHWFYDKQFLENFKGWFLNILEYDGIICISQTAADDLKSWIEANAPHKKDAFSFDVFPMGSDEDNANFSDTMPRDAETVLNKISSKPSFLLVSTVEPRKGHLQAIKAFELLWERGEDINLVFVGKHGWLADKIVKLIKKHELFGEKLFWLTDPFNKDSGASEKYLNEAYKASTCLIFPSAGEGFGLPIVEAARHGLPLILRDIPIFREVAGDNVYYFSGFEAEDLASAITEWLKLYGEGRHPKSDGIKTYTWKESAEALLKILLKE